MTHGGVSVRKGDCSWRLLAHHEVFAWLGAWPTLHGEHCPPTPALPGAHASHGVVALLAVRCWPALHWMHALLPFKTLKYVDDGHSVQLSLFPVGILCRSVQLAQREAPDASENKPGGHFWHVTPSFEYRPLSHVLHDTE